MHPPLNLQAALCSAPATTPHCSEKHCSEKHIIFFSTIEEIHFIVKEILNYVESTQKKNKLPKISPLQNSHCMSDTYLLPVFILKCGWRYVPQS